MKHGPELVVRSQRRPGWAWFDNEIIDRFGEVLGPIALAVYFALCRYAGNETGSCRVLVATLAEKIAVSDRSVRDALKALERSGLVVATRHFGGASTYTLCQVSKSIRQQMPDCVERQDVPDVAASSAGISGRTCRHNKTAFNKTSRNKTTDASFRKVPTDLESRAARVAESLDFAANEYLLWMFARAIRWLGRFEGLSPETAELELVKRIQVFPEYRERGELDRFWLCDQRFMTDEGRAAATKYSASRAIQ